MTSLSTRFAVSSSSIPPATSCFRKFFPTLAQCLLIALALFFCAETAFAQTESWLYSFTGTSGDGSYPRSGVVVDSSGNLYGTTETGGAHGYGTVYELSPPVSPSTTWTKTILYSFGGTPDGYYPFAGVIMDSSGNLYGTTLEGGVGYGTFYELSKSGGSWTESTINLSGTGVGETGQYPYDYGTLSIDPSGNVYGTAEIGGGNAQGTVFEVSSGTLSLLYTFAREGTNLDGDFPLGGNLVFDSSGNIYGTTYEGGTTNTGGTVFEVPKGGGSDTVLYNFGGTGDGYEPYGGLAMDTSGNLYGVTSGGGAHNRGTLFELSCSGSSCTETRLYSFGGTGDVYSPVAGVMVDSSGNVYGTALDGGAHNFGGVFKMTPGVGTFTESWLYSFSGGASDGEFPYGGLGVDSSGNLYGATFQGGAHGYGGVFKIIP